MASIIGNHTITEYNIDVSIESGDGKAILNSNGSGVASINVAVDRGAVGVVNAIKFNPLVITFPGELTGDLTGIKQYAEIEKNFYVAGKVTAVGIYNTEIEVVPGYPIDLADEYFDVNVLDEKGVGMVCTLLSDGTLTGDIDPLESEYESSTGYLYITWLRPLKQGQNITYRKNYTNPPADPVEFTLTGLVGYSTVSGYTLAAQVYDSTLNKPTPIAPGTLMIKATLADDTVATITDDGNGNLVGGYLASATTNSESNFNTVNYRTGEINVSFNSTLKTGENIYLKHTSLLPVKSYRIPNGSQQSEIKINLPWEDLARIVRAIEQAAGTMETGLKYRADT